MSCSCSCSCGCVSSSYVCSVLYKVCVENGLDVVSVCKKYVGVDVYVEWLEGLKEEGEEGVVMDRVRVEKALVINGEERKAAAAAKKADREALKAAKKADREAKKADREAKKAEREAKKAEREGLKAAKKAEREAKKADREALKAAKKAEREALKAAKKAKTSKRVCGNCGKIGHNRRTCSKTNEDATEENLLSSFKTDSSPVAAAEAPVAAAEAPVAAAEAPVAAAEAPVAAAEAPVEKESVDELTFESPSDDEDIMFTHNGRSLIKRKYDGRQAVWDPVTGEHIGDWEGDWESDTGTINMVDSDSEDEEE